MPTNVSYLEYSLNKTIKELEMVVNQTIETNIPDYQEVYCRLGTVISWIGICFNYLIVQKIELTKEEKKYETAFRGANNAQKHAKDIVVFSKFVSGNRFPVSFPMIFGKGYYYFIELDEDTIENKKTVQAYNEVLKKKDILKAIKHVQKLILEKLYRSEV